MNRIASVMKNLKDNHKKAFIPYIMAGDGGLEVLPERMIFLEKMGATAIEIGIPFSDPVADGPVIQAAGKRALENGTTLKAVIQTIANIRPIVQIPFIIMTYFNPVIAYGVQRFIEDCSHAGVDGLIFPDLPIEEEGLITPYTEKAGIEIIRLVTLTTPPERIQLISNKGSGFVYAVTVTGITGGRKEFSQDLAEFIKRVQNASYLPVLAGFGISEPSHVQEMNQYCDGVIVGSKIIDLYEQGDLDGLKELINASKSPVNR